MLNLFILPFIDSPLDYSIHTTFWKGDGTWGKKPDYSIQQIGGERDIHSFQTILDGDGDLHIETLFIPHPHTPPSPFFQHWPNTGTFIHYQPHPSSPLLFPNQDSSTPSSSCCTYTDSRHHSAHHKGFLSFIAINAFMELVYVSLLLIMCS